MAGPSKKPKKRRIEGGGRVTPKGGPAPAPRSRRTDADTADTEGPSSRRYTPPSTNPQDLPSPVWVPVLMFGLMALGMLTIFLNYVSLLPNAVSNWYLLLGLSFILGGIITATQYR